MPSRRCIALDPAHRARPTCKASANLKVASFTQAETAAMRQVAQRRDLRPDDRATLGFALGKALEDAGDYAPAFTAYAAGAAARRSVTPYDAAAFTAETQASMALFTPEFFTARAGFGAANPDPIFIVGLPRSGSTLIEQILASHSAVEGTMELSDIGFIAQQFGWSDPRPPGYPSAVAHLIQARSAGARSARTTFRRPAHPTRKLGKPFFIDKMPNNFQHIGLIQLIAPNARIIDARRHPMATCFSAFKQHFARGQAFTDDLGDLARYYCDYLALMAHFDAVLPGRVHRVIYEDMVREHRGAGGAPAAGSPRPAVRASLPQLPRKPPRGAHRQLRTGAPPHIPRGPGPVAQLRALAGTAARWAGRRAGDLARLERWLRLSAGQRGPLWPIQQSGQPRADRGESSRW